MTGEICILTDPMPLGRYFISEIFKRSVRRYKNRLHRKASGDSPIEYRGHPAVTRSLIAGLTGIGYGFNYNPISLKGLKGTTIVLSGANTLRQAIALKRQGHIDRLVAGPNIVTFSDDFNGIIGSPEVDICITPSQVVCNLYEKYCPSLIGRCLPWPAGVNVEQWKPTPVEKKRVGLIYIKKETPVEIIEECRLALNRFGLRCEILCYGQYSIESYRQILNHTALLIGFTGSESQGIAWAEAWAMDVPTYIQRVDSAVYKNRQYDCSSSPYLNHNNGSFFSSPSELESLIQGQISGLSQYSPRKWVMENMSDQTSAQRLIDIVEGLPVRSLELK